MITQPQTRAATFLFPCEVGSGPAGPILHDGRRAYGKGSMLQKVVLSYIVRRQDESNQLFVAALQTVARRGVDRSCETLRTRMRRAYRVCYLGGRYARFVTGRSGHRPFTGIPSPGSDSSSIRMSADARRQQRRLECIRVVAAWRLPQRKPPLRSA